MDVTSVNNNHSQSGGQANQPVASVPATQAATPVQTVNAVTQAAQVPNLEQTKDAVKTLNDLMKSMSRNLAFSYDSDIDRTVVTVKDSDTNEVIRQIPTEEAIGIAKAIGQFQGLLLKQQA
jgi:flagellar protein FlaG